MFLTVHSTAALAVGASIANPAGAFFISLLLHYVLDAVPHGDENLKELSIKNKAKIAILDHLGAVIIFSLVLLSKPDFLVATSIFFALFGAFLPDWIMGVHELTARSKSLFFIHKIFTPIQKFHSYWHFKLLPYTVNFKTGMIIQLLFMFGFWLLI